MASLEKVETNDLIVLMYLKAKYWKKTFEDMVAQALNEPIDYQEYFQKFNELFGSEWYEYGRGQYRIKLLYWTTYELKKMAKV